MDVTTTQTSSASSVQVTTTPLLVLAATQSSGGVQDAEDQRGAAWEGILAVEGSPTVDGRYLLPGEMGWRDLPIPLRMQPADIGAHDGAVSVGRIDTIQVIPAAKFDKPGFDVSHLGPKASVIWGEGTLDTSPAAGEAERMLANGAGVSMDPGSIDRWAFIDPETLEEVPEEDVSFEDIVMGNYLVGYAGKIGGVTIVDIPAFEEASITVNEGVLVASGGGIMLKGMVIDIPHENRVSDEDLPDVAVAMGVTLVAAGAPLKPPRAWFDPPEFSQLTPLTITKEGRVYGHLCDWDGCHTGFGGVCVPPFRSQSGYAFFNVGEIETAEGDLVPVGKLMFSRDEGSGHASTSPTLSIDDVRRHYDDTTRIGAIVRAGEDRFGTYLVGALRHDLSDEDLQSLRLNPPSGDWRPIPGKGSELLAAFSVPVPGFPIARALVACAGESDLTIITGPLVVKLGEKARRRRFAMLRERRLLSSPPADAA